MAKPEVNVKQLRQFLFWLAYTAVLPLGFIALVWVIAQYIPHAKVSFAEVFGTGDLLPVAAILLLNGSADIRMEEDQRVGWVLVTSEVIFLIAGFTAIAIYMVFKTSALELLKAEGTGPEPGALLAYANFSWRYVILAVVYTGSVKARLLRVVA